jgi:fucose 4-O-acetylase-like acetyltransferase
MMLLTYSMSGLWKLFAVISQTLQGQVSAIAPTALARHVAAKLLSSDTTSLLGPWLIEHYWVGWPLMIATLYLELFALWATARVSLHRWFGLGLILLHVSTHLTLNVSFVQNSLWLALFLVFSPFNPDRPDRRSSARDLPLLGRIWSR